MNKVLIIGNGFDLDLGLKTNYSDFIHDKLFIDLKENNSLAIAIDEEYAINKWIDLEVFIKNYIISQNTVDSFANKKDDSLLKQEFYAIQNSLNEYIGNKAVYNSIKTDSIASRLLNAIRENGDYDIYNFNYTNFKGICRFCGISKLDCKHVHGQAYDNSIILGVEDHKDIPDDHLYIIKSFSHHYISRNIRKALKDASDIIIFGHSLGETDYHYFSDFFEEQSSKDLYKKEKNITIFTYNRESEVSILKQLRRMNPNNDIGRLRDMNKFRIFCTSSEEDRKNIESFFLELANSGNAKLMAGLEQALL